jgi:phosphoribosylanthranilate isomerase
MDDDSNTTTENRRVNNRSTDTQNKDCRCKPQASNPLNTSRLGTPQEPATLQAMKLPTDRVAVKICGVTNASDANAAIDAGADLLGFNTWTGTKRFVDLAANAAWIAELPVPRIALLVNASLAEAKRIACLPYIDALQLHGDEDASFCQRVAEFGKPLIKALRASSHEALSGADTFSTRHILLDAHVPGAFGGTGKRIDLDLARDFRARFPAFTLWLAGGLTPENVAEAIAVARPQVVDVSSGVEASPTRKDLGKMRDFIASARGI